MMKEVRGVVNVSRAFGLRVGSDRSLNAEARSVTALRAFRLSQGLTRFGDREAALGIC